MEFLGEKIRISKPNNPGKFIELEAIVDR